jgi:hypothetical protein
MPIRLILILVVVSTQIHTLSSPGTLIYITAIGDERDIVINCMKIRTHWYAHRRLMKNIMVVVTLTILSNRQRRF